MRRSEFPKFIKWKFSMFDTHRLPRSGYANTFTKRTHLIIIFNEWNRTGMGYCTRPASILLQIITICLHSDIEWTIRKCVWIWIQQVELYGMWCVAAGCPDVPIENDSHGHCMQHVCACVRLKTRQTEKFIRNCVVDMALLLFSGLQSLQPRFSWALFSSSFFFYSFRYRRKPHSIYRLI